MKKVDLINKSFDDVVSTIWSLDTKVSTSLLY